MSSQDFGQYNAAARQNGIRLNANEPFVLNGVSTGAPASLASAATVTFTPTTVITTHTPTQNETINFSAPVTAGVEIALEVVTSGTTSFTLTFGTNTKTTGTLATGTVTAKIFIITFYSDGTQWIESGRTTAQ